MEKLPLFDNFKLDDNYEQLSVKIKQYLNFAAVVEKSISFVFCI